MKSVLKSSSLSLLVIIMLTISLIIPSFAFDVDEAHGAPSDIAGHWAYSYIVKGINYGFINGYPDGTFIPDRAVSRAEFAKMVNAAFKNNNMSAGSFKDVPYSEWYYNDVRKAVAAAYVAGYDDGTFLPNKSISRQEASVMLARIVPAYNFSANLNAYSDKAQIADWAYGSFAKIAGKGYMGAYDDGKLHPMDSLTRAQTAKIICDILDKEDVVTSVVTIKKEDDLKDKIYTNNVTIAKDLGEDDVSFSNCVFLGTLHVQGGADSSVLLKNVRAAEINVNKADSPVRVVLQGESIVVKTTLAKASILETKSLAGGTFGEGFLSVDVAKSAEATFTGSFPKVNITGTDAKVNLESATVSDLTVGYKNASITSDSKSTIKNAVVNAVSSFSGEGAITKMEVNVTGVTYETKPKSWTLATGVKAPTYVEGQASITFSPVNNKTDVAGNVQPTITFSNAIEQYGGGAITAAYLKDNIDLREGSASGTSVPFTATIDSAKKVITIKPTSTLSSGEKYYLSFDTKVFRVTSTKENITAKSSAFTVIDTTPKVAFSPVNGKINHPVATSLTVTFSDAMLKSDGKALDEAYVIANITVTKEGDSTNYNTAPVIASSKKVITIAPPASGWVDGATYTISLVGSKFKNASGTYAKAASASFTAGTASPVLTMTWGDSSDIGEKTITVNASSTVNGKAYFIATTGSIDLTDLTEVMIKNGKDPDGNTCPKISGDITGTVKSFTLSGLSNGTVYYVYGVVEGNGSYSNKTKSGAITTLLPYAALESLSYDYTGGSSTVSLSASTVTLTSDAGVVNLTAVGKDSATVNFAGIGVTDYGDGTAEFTLSDTTTSVAVTITATLTDHRDKAYTVTFKRNTI
ncbi:MAG: S-layer homology domain-containing protein [Anaerovoracaceae bacterium]